MKTFEQWYDGWKASGIDEVINDVFDKDPESIDSKIGELSAWMAFAVDMMTDAEHDYKHSRDKVALKMFEDKKARTITILHALADADNVVAEKKKVYMRIRDRFGVMKSNQIALQARLKHMTETMRGRQ